VRNGEAPQVSGSKNDSTTSGKPGPEQHKTPASAAMPNSAHVVTAQFRASCQTRRGRPNERNRSAASFRCSHHRGPGAIAEVGERRNENHASKRVTTKSAPRAIVPITAGRPQASDDGADLRRGDELGTN